MNIKNEKFGKVCSIQLIFTQGEDYLVEKFSDTPGGKFSGWSRNQIFDVNMCKTLI